MSMFSSIKKIPQPYSGLLTEESLTKANDGRTTFGMVDQFLEKNLKAADEINVEASNYSLSDSRNFFKSEIKIVMQLMGKIKILYNQVAQKNDRLEGELRQCRKVINFYKKKQFEDSQNKDKQTINRTKQLKFRLEQNSIEIKKTQKRHGESSEDIFAEVSAAISQFQPEARNQSLSKVVKVEKEKLMKELGDAVEQKKIYKEKLDKALDENKALTKQNSILKSKTNNFEESYGKMIRQMQIRVQMKEICRKNLQKKYKQLEDKIGDMKSEYELKLQNFRKKIKQIQIHNSPKKGYPEGYFSINKPGSHCQSSQLSIKDEEQRTKQIEKNYKEENQYLRNELIKELDKNGQIRAQYIKYQKIIVNYVKSEQENRREMKQKLMSQSFTSNQSEKSHNQVSAPSLNFKKNKTSSIYMVQNTEKKQVQESELRKKNKRKQILDSLLKLLNQPEEKILTLRTLEKLQIIKKGIKQLASKNIQKNKEIQTLKQQKQKIQSDLFKIQSKERNEQRDFKLILEEIKQNPSYLQSQDSTEQAFKNIYLVQRQPMTLEKSKSYGKIQNLSQTEKICLKKILEQENIIVNLKSSLWDLKYPIIDQSQSVEQSRFRNQKINQKRESQTAQVNLSHFDMFKERLTQFYQNTIHQLSQLQQNIQEKSNDQPKRLKQPQICEQGWMVLKKSWMRLSRQFEDIQANQRSHIELNEKIKENERVQCLLQKQMKLSRSFTADDAFKDIIKKRMEEFQEYSSNLINQILPPSLIPEKIIQKPQSKRNQNQLWNLQFNQSAYRVPAIESERQKIENRETLRMLDIDAKSESVSSEELMRQRNLIIRQESSNYFESIEHRKFPHEFKQNRASYQIYSSSSSSYESRHLAK